MSDLTEADRKLVEDARLFVANPKTRAVAPMWCEHIDGLLGIIDRQAPTLSIKSDSLAECATLFRAMKDNPGAPLRASIEIKGHPHLTATEPFSGEFEFRTDDALGSSGNLAKHGIDQDQSSICNPVRLEWRSGYWAADQLSAWVAESILLSTRTLR